MTRSASIIGAMVLALGIAPLAAQAQTGMVRGRVTDEASSTPLAGVTVSVGSHSAVTGSDGRYLLSGLSAGMDSLRARLLGYAPHAQAVTVVAGQTVDADIALAAQAVRLAEMVVTGYGEQAAGNITGAVTQVNSNQFNTGPIIAPEQLIQAKVAGVEVVDNNEPGGGMAVRIRGTTSVNASSEPLYVVDGVPVGGTRAGGGTGGRDPLNFLNPEDIASITVLRDASSAAIYGANGASGVVLVTTRRGQRGGPQFEYSTSFSASSVTRLPDVMNADQFRRAVFACATRKCVNGADTSAGAISMFGTTGDTATAAYRQLGNASTNWLDLVTRAGYGATHDLSVSGAGESNSWRLSFGYMHQSGVVSHSGSRRLSLGANYTQRLFHDRVNVQANLRGSRVDDQFVPNGYGTGGILSNAAQMGPTQPVLNAADTGTGFYNWPSASLTSPDNPLEILSNATSHGVTYRSIGNMTTEWKLPVFDDAFTAHFNVGYDVTQYANGFFGSSALHAERKTGYGGENVHANTGVANTLFESYLTWAPLQTIMKGTLDITGGYSFSAGRTDYSSLYQRGLSTDLLGPNGTASSSTTTPYSNVTESRLISFFGRANYNYGDRYLFGVSVRRDGSSRFGPNNAWGTFPAVAFAWRLSQESFFRGMRSLSDLKLRVSWAKTGNQSFADYQQYAAYTYANPQAQVQFGNQWVTPIRPSAVDPNIKWESTGSTNIGVDFGFNNQRISGTIDWYDKKTSDMIFNVPVPGGSNNSNYVTTNIGSMRNRGIELGLEARLKNGGAHALGWTTNWTASHNVNTVLTINPSVGAAAAIPDGGIQGGVGNTAQIITPGHAFDAFYLCTQAYANGKPVDGGYLDSTGAVFMTNGTNCYRTARHSPAPDWIFGHSSYITYGKLDLSFTLRAYLGNYVYNNVASSYGDYRELSAGTSPYNLHTSVLTTQFTQQRLMSDYYLEDASFLRMDNITVGYAFNYRNMPYRLYLTMQNAFTLTGYSGVDPTAGLNGIDSNIYPRARTVSGGMSVRF